MSLFSFVLVSLVSLAREVKEARVGQTSGEVLFVVVVFVCETEKPAQFVCMIIVPLEQCT